MARRIVQFGTSRFLQAHADLFVHEARLAGQDIGPITVVKTTAGAERRGRIDAMRGAEGFPVRIRGYRDGNTVDETVQVRSVDQALTAVEDWPDIVELFAQEAELAISNVGERGYEIPEEDRRRPSGAGHVPASFPAKLLLLLLARHDAGGKPLLFLPCELLPSNGGALRKELKALASGWDLPTPFMDWLAHAVTFGNTLVDRIVSQDIEPVGAIAEPYALWAIRNGGFVPPILHPAIVYTNDLRPFERLKLHILNLGHTVLAETWSATGARLMKPCGKFLPIRRFSSVCAASTTRKWCPAFAALGYGRSGRRLREDHDRAVQEPVSRSPHLGHRAKSRCKD